MRFPKDENKVVTIEGSVDVELHGSLAYLQVRPAEEADWPGGVCQVRQCAFEMGIPSSAIGKYIVNDNVVNEDFIIQPGDKVAFYPAE